MMVVTGIHSGGGGSGAMGGSNGGDEWMDLREEQEDEVPALMWEHLAVKSFLLCPEKEG